VYIVYCPLSTIVYCLLSIIYYLLSSVNYLRFRAFSLWSRFKKTDTRKNTNLGRARISLGLLLNSGVLHLGVPLTLAALRRGVGSGSSIRLGGSLGGGGGDDGNLLSSLDYALLKSDAPAEVKADLQIRV
jgi:hypothetical protein